jgi:type VI secretion system Hcp family effector
MRRSTFIAAFAAVSLSAATAARADTIVFTAKGAKQGEIKGSLTQRGREGAMQCTQWSAAVAAPRDASSGAASGKRQYKPITCVKKVDNASPALLRALAENENLSEVLFRVFAPKGGAEAVVYSVELKSANVTGIRQFTAPDGTLMEEVEIAFGTIKVAFGDVAFEDSPRGAK